MPGELEGTGRLARKVTVGRQIRSSRMDVWKEHRLLYVRLRLVRVSKREGRMLITRGGQGEREKVSIT